MHTRALRDTNNTLTHSLSLSRAQTHRHACTHNPCLLCSVETSAASLGSFKDQFIAKTHIYTFKCLQQFLPFCLVIGKGITFFNKEKLLAEIYYLKNSDDFSIHFVSVNKIITVRKMSLTIQFCFKHIHFAMFLSTLVDSPHYSCV